MMTHTTTAETSYIIRFEDGWTEHITASSLEDACKQARQMIRDAWDAEDTTVWADATICDADGRELDDVTVAIDPPEPPCTARAHEWESPVRVVGGYGENPGVSGHGGGIVIREVCAHCGRYRITDTWATRPDTGRQGLQSVRYEDADETSRAWIAERDDE